MRYLLACLTLTATVVSACSTSTPIPETTTSTPSTQNVSKEGIRLINQQRRANGFSKLATSERLNRVAKRHAIETERRGYGLNSTFNVHTSLDGSSVTDRIKKSGYRSCLSVENAAWGQKDAPEVITDWVVSDGHRFNTFHPKITHVGMAKSGKVWIMVGSKPCKGERP